MAFLNFHEFTENTHLQTAIEKSGLVQPLSLPDLNAHLCKALPLALAGAEQNSKESSNRSKTQIILQMGTGQLRVLQDLHESFGRKSPILARRDTLPLSWTKNEEKISK